MIIIIIIVIIFFWRKEKTSFPNWQNRGIIINMWATEGGKSSTLISSSLGETLSLAKL